MITKTFLIILTLSTSITAPAIDNNQKNFSKTNNHKSDTRTSFPINEIKNFVNVYSMIKGKFLYPLDDTEMINNAIKGMVDNLDDYSTFLDKEIFAKVKKKLKGDRVGVGIEIVEKDNEILIMTSIYGAPAYQAGIRSGDKIVQINDTPITNQNLAKVNDELSGLPNTFVSLYIENANKKIKKYNLKRTLIKFPSVFQNNLKNQYIHIRISQFQNKTPSEIIGKLRNTSNKNIRGLIIDLRDNPGGLLEAAVKSTDLFLSKGGIVSILDRSGEIAERYSAKPPTIIDLNTPMVVIINEGTASAAEIMAGALKDNKRAIVIGRNSYGKGSIQSIVPLPNKTAAKLTTAVYILPSGNKIKSGGIQPDISVEPIELWSSKHADGRKVADDRKDKGLMQDHILFQAIKTLEVMNKINSKN